jgi:NitT/TauT family transport system permease protein
MVTFWVVLTLGHEPQNQIIPLLPSPAHVGGAFLDQWKNGAIYQLLTSTFLSLEAVTFASIIGLGLVYLATIAAFRAPVDWIGKLRFLSLTGVLVVFIAMTPNGHILKLSVLTFSVVVFLVNNMLQVIEDIPESRFDYARTLGLSDWQVLREVVIRGTLADAFESIRMNAAMAWMMLTLVEGLSRSEGGVGVLLLSLQRSGDYAAIFAIQLMILMVGMGQDRLIKIVKGIACPYTLRG